MSSPATRSGSELPPVDVRLVAPESRYEIDEGRLEYVAPSDEPHGSRHSKLSALLEAYVRAEWDVASDMLTRTSETSDVAPDASVFPVARDEETGGRRLEELAFEVVSTERLSHAAKKASKLASRGVRRVFAIDVERKRALEWSRSTQTWELLAPDSNIEDVTLAAPLAVAALVGAAKADDAVAQALVAKRNPVIEAVRAESRTDGWAEGKVEGKAEGKVVGKVEDLLMILDARGLTLTSAQREQIENTRDRARLDAWIRLAVRCSEASELFRAK
jgi:Uma2 family endonuclease